MSFQLYHQIFCRSSKDNWVAVVRNARSEITRFDTGKALRYEVRYIVVDETAFVRSNGNPVFSCLNTTVAAMRAQLKSTVGLQHADGGLPLT